MKRLPLALVALALLLVPAVTPGSAGTDAVLHEFAVGGGSAPCEPGAPAPFACPQGSAVQHFAFSAHQEVGATTPSGHAVLWFADSSGKKTAQVSGPVTCFIEPFPGVVAQIAFEVKRSTLSSAPAGTSVAFSVADREEFGNPDAISAPSVSALQCQSAPPHWPVTKGNIVVAPQSPAVATALSDSWYSVGSDGSLSILTETGWEVMQ
jgi:hypothetical protein